MTHSLLKRPNRRALLGAFALTAAAAGSPLSAGESRTSFVALGDWGRRGEGRQRAVAASMATAAEAVSSRFVITLGDNFYENGVQSVTDAQWKLSFEEVYTATALQTPWYPVLGNHDHRGSAQAQVDYSRTSSRWRLPDRYYRVSGAEHGAPHLDLFFLDTTVLVVGHDPASPAALQRAAATQLAWLEAQLKLSRAPWRLVVGHHTIHSGGSQHGDTQALVASLKPLLETHGVQAYINGHDHDLQHIRRGVVDYIGAGAGSRVRAVRPVEGTRFCLARPGFALFTLESQTLTLEFRDFTGVRVYHTALPRLRA